MSNLALTGLSLIIGLSCASSVDGPFLIKANACICNSWWTEDHLMLCRLDCELSLGYLSGVVCVQRPAPLPGAVVCAGQQGHVPAVPLPLLHPALLLLWQHCCGPHLGPVPP